MTDNLYIWVISQEQKELYEKALEGKTYKAIMIRPEPELYKCYKTVSDYFPEGQPILWMEDKVRMYSFLSKENINLNYWVNDAFKTVKENNIGAFTFCGQTNYRPNKLFLKKRPFKEIGFYPAYGSVSGFINHKGLWELQEHHKYQGDCILWLRYFDKYGGILKYNFIFYTANWCKTPGGLSFVSEERRSRKECDHVMATEDIGMYIKDVAIKNGFPTFIYKTGPQVKKINPRFQRRIFKSKDETEASMQRGYI